MELNRHQFGWRFNSIPSRQLYGLVSFVHCESAKHAHFIKYVENVPNWWRFNISAGVQRAKREKTRDSFAEGPQPYEPAKELRQCSSVTQFSWLYILSSA